MKNIKRILCLTLSAIMLCGMMVFNTGASFKDEAKIVNKEAAAITAGLGLFAGTTEGNFDPTGTVTRAQMAAIVTKMLYGSDFNADHFKGSGKFSDTAVFEGGWAEGYVNLGSNIGVIAGYGDGTFKPGKAVTTAEAVTMIINALKVDAGKGTWPLTVMAKAEEMKLFKDVAVKPGTNEALTRDQLAPMVLAAIKYSPNGTTGYKVPNVPFVFDSFTDALMAVASSQIYDITDITEVVGEDTLAKQVFNMVSTTGFVTDNQATGATYTEIDGVQLNLNTGLDMIGHYVTAYYATEYKDNDPGITYCIVDEAEYVTVNEAISASKKEYQKVFGTKKLTVAEDVVLIDGIYTFDTTTAYIKDYDADNWTAPCGTYVIHDNEIIAFMENTTKILSKVNRVSTIVDREYILVNGIPMMDNNLENDIVNEYTNVTKGDIVVVTEANGIYTLTKANTVVGKITRTSKIDGVNTITINGMQYQAFDSIVDNNTGLNTDIDHIDWDETYVVYTDGNNYIGWENVGITANISDFVYIIDTYSVDGVADAYGNVTTNTYAQGVDMNGKEVSYLIANSDNLGDASITPGFYTFKLSNTNAERKAGIYTKHTVINDEYVVIGAIGNNNESVDSKTAYVNAMNDIAFIENHTKFIVVDETTAKQELDVAIRTGTYFGDINNCPAIFSKDAYGNLTLEAVIIYDDVAFNADDYIYITEDNANQYATVANGSMYTVYFVNDGIVKDIISNQKNLTEGFYQYSTEIVDGVTVYNLETNTDTFVENEEFIRLSGTKLVSNEIKALEAGKAKILDGRKAETIKNHDIAEVIELEDLTAAKDAGYAAVFTAILNDDKDEVLFIVITGFTVIPEQN